MISRNRVLILILMVIAILSIPVVVSAGENEYVFLLKGRGNIFWKTVRRGIEETAKEQNLRAVILNTDDDQTPEAQLDMCLASISRKPKIIVMGAATKNIGIACFKKAIAAGIPVADIDGNVTTDDARQAGISLAFSVASDNVAIGEIAAGYLAGVSDNKSPRVLVIKGLPGSIVSEKRAKGFINRLNELLPKAVIVGAPAANWDRMKAMNTALDFIQREDNLNFIFSVSDAMSTGVVEALKVSGKSNLVQLISVDGNAEARKAILGGQMLANVAQLPFLMGKRSVELALVQTSKKKMDGYSEFTAVPLLTKEVLQKMEDPNLKFLR